VFKLAQITKDHRDAAALCAQVNLFGFADDETFLTKGGDLSALSSVTDVPTVEQLQARADYLSY
jgi:hypothetical protein